jgi:demethylspheroidene O-methyltransferase
LQLLKAIRRAMPIGGSLLLTEPMADTPGAKAMGHAYFGMYLWAMGRGRSRSAETITQMLRDAGFSKVQEIATRIPLQARILLAK